MNPNVLIITFASRGFKEAAFILRASLFFSGLLKDVNFNCFSEKHLPSSLLSYAEKNPSGFGYWRWKPYFIDLALKSKEYDFVVYIDSTYFVRRKFKYIIHSLKSGGRITLYQNLACSNYLYSKPIPQLGKSYADFRLTDYHVDASLVIFGQDKESRLILEKWTQLCGYHDYISNPQQNAKHYHRHDQTLLSYAAWLRNIELNPPIDGFTVNQKSFVMHHRLSRKSIRQKLIRKIKSVISMF